MRRTFAPKRSQLQDVVRTRQGRGRGRAVEMESGVLRADARSGRGEHTEESSRYDTKHDCLILAQEELSSNRK